MGATEVGAPPGWLPPVGDWQYFHFNPEFKGVELRPVEDDLYQFFLVRDPLTDAFHGTWYTFPDAKEYTMNDLYQKHPTKKNLWLYAGRADDIIVLSNGEKFNPTSMELKLLGHMGITGALVVGQARFAPAAVIELEDGISRKVQDKEEREAFLNAFWPFVAEANKSAPAHAQIARDKIIFNDPEKRFVRVAKGTVQRKATTKLYEKEIDELYKDDNKDDLENVPRIDLAQDAAVIEGPIASLFAAVMGVEKISPSQDFFALGMDSLQVMKVSRQLEAAFEGKLRADSISRLIYSNSTVELLTAALKDASGGKAGVKSEVAMQQTLDRFKKQLPQAGGLAVILTGSTGSLGSYLLDALASAPNVKKIYCLNRRPDASEHQAATNAARGLISEWGERVVFFHADLSKPKLGLKQQEYDTLRADAGAIIRESRRTLRL
jgi:acyl carrier protein